MIGFLTRLDGCRGLVGTGAILAVLLSADVVAAAPVTGLPTDLGLGVTGTFMDAPDATLLQVQCGSGSGGQGDGEGDCYAQPEGSPRSNAATPVSEDTTERLVDVITTAKDTCSDEWIKDTYRIDCIRQTLLLAAAKLPTRGDYAPVRDALLDAAGKLDKIVKQNGSASSGSVSPPIGGRPLAPTLPPLRAINPAAQEKAVSEAIAVLEEAQTILLRSAENSSRRLEHYQQVAQAIDSTKVLLRSS